MKRIVSVTLAVVLVVGLAGLAGIAAARSAPEGQQGQRQMSEEERARMRAERDQEQLVAPRPIEAADTVWIEEMTWMEVRDAIADGKTTAIVSTGGVEQNGPYLATGKHNYVLQGACEGIARELGNALCAPIIKLVPEGDIEPPSGHMRYPGTLSLQQATFEAVLEDVGSSLRAHGFEHVVFIGDSGGNQQGMETVATRLAYRWDGGAHYIPEFYRYREVFEYMDSELGISEPTNDGLHDDFVITSIMMTVAPTAVRYEQRVAAVRATINGLSIEPLEETVAIGEKLLQFRVDRTVAAIRDAIAGSASTTQ